MEIITLLKANIRKKKGTFISILLLTAIVTAMTTSIFSVRDNYQNGMEKAFDVSGSGDIFALIPTKNLTKELCERVENHPLVERVDYHETIISNGIESKTHSYSDSQFLRKMHDGIKMYKEELNAFVEETPKLEKGEIYLPLGFKPLLDCNVGDSLSLHFYADQTEEFKLKGFVQEPTIGAMTIGWKPIFINDADYERLHKTYTSYESEDVTVNVTIMNIHQSSTSTLSPAKFQRQLNLDTKVADLSRGTLNKDQSIRYSTLMPEVILDIVLAFILFLFLIVLIIISHSIATEIEIDYITLGILKSQGFTKNKIRLLFLFQYLLTQVAGMIVGILISVPIERMISSIFQLVTGVLSDHGLAISKCIIITASILMISAILILYKTQKIAKISAVRAISGGHEEIYFDSRLNAPILKKGLLTSLSYRQFTSAKMRYIGTIFIASLLAFSMITANLIGNLLTSRKSLKAMGLEASDIEVFLSSKEFSGNWKETDKIVESYSPITEKNSETAGYASLNGETLRYHAYEFPEYLTVLKGRAPLYDNEIVITEMVRDLLEINMGDELTVSYADGQDRFIVSGIFQSTYDSGMVFAMNFNGAEKVGIDTRHSYRYYILEDSSQIHNIADKITEKYEDDAEITLNSEEENGVTEQYDLIVNVLKIIIYSFSLIFAFIVVGMVCNRTFIQERTDIGIFKALGFTSRKLRLSFAVRFMIVGITGATLGIFLSILLSAKMLGAVFGLIGISYIVLDFTLSAVFIPVFTICLSFAIFAYLTSWKIKKVSVRELVVE